MSDLEPIQFNKYRNIQNTQNTIQEIQDCIFRVSNITVDITKFQPPKLVISASNASAAAELHLLQDEILTQLKHYRISQLSIIIR